MLAISPDGSTLYVTVRDEDQLYVVSTKDLTVTAAVPTGRDPHGVAYRQTTGSATVARGGGDELGDGRPGRYRWCHWQASRAGWSRAWWAKGCAVADMCMTPEAASMSGRPIEPVGLLGMMGDGQIDPARGTDAGAAEVSCSKAMGDVMIKHGQAMSRRAIAAVVW